MTNSVHKKHDAVKRLSLMAMFIAVAYLVEYVFHVKVLFLTMDLKDCVVTLAGMIFGPIYALIMSPVLAVLELVISDTGFWGMIMNFFGTLTFSLTASLVYRHKKTMLGALFALLTAIIAMPAVMMPANLLVTPIYTGSTTAEIAALIPTLLLPFNLAKAILNAGAVLVLYKPVVNALRSARLVERSNQESRSVRSSIISLLVALLLIAVSAAILIGMNASIEWMKS